MCNLKKTDISDKSERYFFKLILSVLKKTKNKNRRARHFNDILNRELGKEVEIDIIRGGKR